MDALYLRHVCTLVAALHHFSGFPLVVGANRDERYDRPASPVQLWQAESFVAPRDEAAGGTWLGLNARGLFVGVTNRFGAAKDRRARRTRLTAKVPAPFQRCRKHHHPRGSRASSVLGRAPAYTRSIQ
jgi:uncharacterized protein with NRDE domain